MPRRAARTDRNHASFAQAFKTCAVPYEDVHALPGALDFLALSRSGRLYRFEVKVSEKEPLTDKERETFDKFPGVCFKVWDAQQALDILFDQED